MTDLSKLSAEIARLIRSGRNASGQTQEQFWDEMDRREFGR